MGSIGSVSAQESDFQIVESTYLDRYTLEKNTTEVHVERNIRLKNTTAKLYVSEYAMSFINGAEMSNFSLSDEKGAISYQKDTQGNTVSIRARFDDPAVGNAATKQIKISYTLKNVLKKRGDSYELLIPINNSSASEKLTDYQIEVRTPADFIPVSIAKPPIKEISEGLYRWSDVQNFTQKTLNIFFGTRALYYVELHYELKNSFPYTKHYIVPFVPEGVFQKVYVYEINPPPSSVETDIDGNYLGTFAIPAGSVKTVVFRGYVELTTTPREEIRTRDQEHMAAATKSRYLTQESYWTVDEDMLKKIPEESRDSIKGVYEYVVKKLSYSLKRASGNDVTRMGASWIMNNPTLAVCMEYTDLLIALLREQGTPAREVVGYAVTGDETVLPSSFFGDVLHAWPEYYDSAREYWHPVDPTWEDTAGMDYFSAFDLNHIALVYHGKDTTYPLPPGVYKVRSNTKDVLVTATDALPPVKTDTLVNTPKNLSVSRQNKKLPLTITSKANVFLYDVEVMVREGKNKTVLASSTIPRLEPYRKVDLIIPLEKLGIANKKGTLYVEVNSVETARLSYEVKQLDALIPIVIVAVVGSLLLATFYFALKKS